MAEGVAVAATAVAGIAIEGMIALGISITAAIGYLFYEEEVIADTKTAIAAKKLKI